MNYIKNVPFGEVFDLFGSVNAEEGQVVSKTLAQNSHHSITLFAMSKNEEISTHESDGDALVYVKEGTGEFTIAGARHVLEAGQSIVMPHNVAHSVKSLTCLKFALIVIFEQ